VVLLLVEILLDSWTNDEQRKYMYGQTSVLPAWDFMSHSCGFAK